MINKSLNPDFTYLLHKYEKSARRADRLNPIGFNLARRGNPKQISNAKFGLKLAFVILIITSLSGCTFIFQKARRSDIKKIEDLSKQLDDLNNAKRLLEDRLAQEIRDKQVKLEMTEKGLVITFVADILFDSGKAKIRSEAYPVLDKVSVVLKENVPNLNIGIEGHTDNEPIRYSGWKSNWELSSARALSVLHFLADDKGILPERLSALAYGEYKPVSTNDSKESRQLNRRVEIVVIPQIKKVKVGRPTMPATPEENLK